MAVTHLHALHDARAELTGPLGEALRYLGGAGEAVLRAPDGGDQIVHAQGGHDGVGVFGRDDAHVDAEALLQCDARLEPAQRLLVRHEEQIADLLEAGIDAELLREVLEHAQALEGETDLRLRGELGADAARGLAGGAAAHRLALEDDDVALAAAGQIVGDAAAHHAAADDDHAGRFWLAHG